MAGRVILLSGASSSGKSSILRAFRERVDAPFRHVSFDKLHEAEVLPMARLRTRAGRGAHCAVDAIRVKAW